MVVTSSPDELLETVRSRCQRIDLAPLPEAALHRRARPRARRSRVGRLRRGWPAAGSTTVRAMLGVLGDVRHAFVTVAAQLDGTGGSAMRGVDQVTDALQVAVAHLDAQHTTEVDELSAELDHAPRISRAVTDRAAQAAGRAPQAPASAAPGPTSCSRASPHSSPCTATCSPAPTRRA